MPNCFSNLLSLTLSANGFEKLDLTALEGLRKLRKLDLSFNKLTKPPKGILRIQSIETINLARNDLQKLSPEIKQLPNLKKLDLSDNNIGPLGTDVFKSHFLEQFPAGCTIDLSDNSFRSPYFRLREQGEDYEGYRQAYQEKLVQHHVNLFKNVSGCTINFGKWYITDSKEKKAVKEALLRNYGVKVTFKERDQNI